MVKEKIQRGLHQEIQADPDPDRNRGPGPLKGTSIFPMILSYTTNLDTWDPEKKNKRMWALRLCQILASLICQVFGNLRNLVHWNISIMQQSNSICVHVQIVCHFALDV